MNQIFCAQCVREECPNTVCVIVDDKKLVVTCGIHGLIATTELPYRRFMIDDVSLNEAQKAALKKEVTAQMMPFPPDPDAGYVRHHASIHADLLRANLDLGEQIRLLKLENERLKELSSGGGNLIGALKEFKRVGSHV